MTTQKRSKWRLSRGLAVLVVVAVPVLALALFGGSARALLSAQGVGPEFRVLEPAPEPRAKAPSAAPAPRSDDQTVVELASWENTDNPGNGNNGNGNGKGNGSKSK